MFTKYKLIAAIIFAVLFLGSIFGTAWYAYTKAYNRGFVAGETASKLDCQKDRALRDREYIRLEAEKNAIMQKIMEKVDELFVLSKSLATANIQKQEELRKDIERLRKAAENKPLVVIKDGKCTLSKEFQDTYNSIISRGNLP